MQNLFDNGPQAANEIAQGQADIGLLELSKYVYPYTAKGAPVTMSFPKEGSFAGNNCQVLVKNGPNQDLAVAFMNRMLEPAVQKAVVRIRLTAPPISGIEFSDRDAEIPRLPGRGNGQARPVHAGLGATSTPSAVRLDREDERHLRGLTPGRGQTS